MSRLVHRSIEIERWFENEPQLFRDGDKLQRVKTVMDRWLETGDWWNGEGHRRMVRVLTEDCGLYDLECTGEHWFIYKVWD